MGGSSIGPEHKPSLAFELRGSVVVLEFSCVDVYSAIELYEELIASARGAGMVKLVVDGMTPHGREDG